MTSPTPIPAAEGMSTLVRRDGTRLLVPEDYAREWAREHEGCAVEALAPMPFEEWLFSNAAPLAPCEAGAGRTGEGGGGDD